MSIVVHATPAREPKSSSIVKISLFVTILFIILALAQLFSFAKFGSAIYDMWLPGVTMQLATVLAALVVILEVFSIPFLLGMWLSPLMRLVSMVFGWLVIAWWLYVLVWQNVTPLALENNGLLGGLVHLPVGWWAVWFIAAMGVLVAWVSWGRWPFPLRSTQAR